MSRPLLVSGWVVAAMICMNVTHTLSAQPVAVDAAFLEFLGMMVESDGDLISPLDLYEYEQFAKEAEFGTEPESQPATEEVEPQSEVPQ